MSEYDKVLDQLARQPDGATVAEIIDATGVERSYVNYCLWRMTEAGRAVKRDATWRLTAKVGP